MRRVLERLFRRHRLILVSSPALAGGYIDGPQGKLYHSGFNVKWLEELGITPTVIVDAGSFDGGDAFRLLRSFPLARVVAIEADPIRFAILKENLAGESIELVEAAVCDVDGDVDWFSATIEGQVDSQGAMYRQSAELNQRFPFVKQAEHPMRVAGKRIDNICSELGIARIDLLHMDVQGAEHVALLGLGDLRPRLIYLEVMRDNSFVGAGDRSNIDAFLERTGYVLAADLKTDLLYFLPQ